MNFSYESIAVSGVPGSGKSSLITEVQDRLGSYGENWELYPVGDMLREEHEKSGLTMPFHEWFAQRTPEQNLDTNKKLLEGIGSKDYRIADTRFVQFFDPKKVLRLWVDAPLDVRAQRASGNPKYSGKAINEIKDILIKREFDEVAAGQTMWGSDYDFRRDHYYHAFLDSGMQSVDEEATVVMNHLLGHLSVPPVVFRSL